MSERQKQMVDEFIEMKKRGLLIGGPGFLQTFAGEQDDDLDDDDKGGADGDDQDDDDQDDHDDDDHGDGDPGDDDLDFEYSRGAIDKIMTANEVDFGQLLKDNPQLKKAYTERFNKNMSKRLDKYKDVDVDEYRDLKQRAESGKLEGDAKTWKDKHDKLLVQVEQQSQRTAIQNVAIAEKLDAEQIAFVSSMINTSNLEKDDEGEWMGIEDEIDRIREKFPRMFDVKESNDDDNDGKGKDKKKYNPGKGKHNNGTKDTDAKERGRQRALARHKQK